MKRTCEIFATKREIKVLRDIINEVDSVKKSNLSEDDKMDEIDLLLEEFDSCLEIIIDNYDGDIEDWVYTWDKSVNIDNDDRIIFTKIEE